ncbi:hypothetical protein J5N97_024820 [Dioscorea zingiberensis]|uniref:Uncharacterized protein n=1 Tax=Dioscorea zingiberensis TaxID=325984 RepID=A0A9D5C7Z3_9LILI|nr:hypothetical protein J5N97_024820 [Dioscorea zingiberensis]
MLPIHLHVLSRIYKAINGVYMILLPDLGYGSDCDNILLWREPPNPIWLIQGRLVLMENCQNTAIYMVKDDMQQHL